MHAPGMGRHARLKGLAVTALGLWQRDWIHLGQFLHGMKFVVVTGNVKVADCAPKYKEIAWGNMDTPGCRHASNLVCSDKSNVQSRC